MAKTLDDLTTPLTAKEIKASIFGVLAQLGVDTTVWKPGSVVRTMIAGSSVVLAALSRLMSSATKSGFLDTAEGAWLTILADQVYNVQRIAATFATGTLELSNTSGSTYNIDPGDLIVSSSKSGKTYRNVNALTLNPGATDVEATFAATEAGADSTAAAGEIDTLETTLLGVTVTNPKALVGSDKETDADLRQRAKESTGALSPNGPADAYLHVARSAKRSDGTSIGVTRVSTTTDGQGNVTVYVATPTGSVSGSSGDSGTDLGAIHDAIQKQAVPLAVTEETKTATEIDIDVEWELWLYEDVGLTEAEIATKVEKALAEFMSRRPIGGDVAPPDAGKLYISGIEGAIARQKDIAPSFIRLEISEPSDDVSVAQSKVPTLRNSTPVAIHFVALPNTN